MAYCKHCGTEIPDFAKFCPKCGTADPVQVQEVQEPPKAEEQPVTVKEEQPTVAQPAQQAQPAAQPAQQKPAANSDPDVKGWFARNFTIIYVLTGILSYALIELAGGYMAVSEGFCITLGVFAILVALAFALIGIVNFITSLSASPEQRANNRNKSIIMFTIGIVVFVYVLLMGIAIFKQSNMWGMLGF